MTTAKDSLAYRLALSICGPVTGDPLMDAVRAANLAGAARLGEMGETGFDTDTPFDNVNQAKYVGEGRVPFLVTSLGTDTAYFVVVLECVGEVLHVAIAVHPGDHNPKAENLRMMTFSRNADGNVHAAPGW